MVGKVVRRDTIGGAVERAEQQSTQDCVRHKDIRWAEVAERSNVAGAGWGRYAPPYRAATASKLASQ